MKKFFLFFILFIALVATAYILISSYTFSEGHRDGYVMKFSKKGFIFKTYEGTLNLDFINTSGGRLSSNTWEFSVDKSNKALIDSLINVGDTKIRFFYHEKVNALPWKGDTKYFVYKFEPLQSPARPQRGF